MLILMIIKSYNIYINYYYYTYPSVDLPPPKKKKKIHVSLARSPMKISSMEVSHPNLTSTADLLKCSALILLIEQQFKCMEMARHVKQY